MSDKVLIDREVVLFLCGTEPLDGAWYGEPPPDGRPAFWWRKRLSAGARAASDALRDALAQGAHDLYTDADMEVPGAILDRNGAVALALCKRCGKGEAELDGPCELAQKAEPVARCAQLVDGEPLWVDPDLCRNGIPLYLAPPAAPADGWQEEARRYCANADHWRERAEKAEAALAAKETL